MPHPIIEHFTSEVKIAGQPCFTSETQVACGRLVITASPNLDSEKLQSLKLEMPVHLQLNEPAYFYLFLISIFGVEVFTDFEPRIRPAMLATSEFSEIINDWKLRMFIENESRVVLVEAMSH